MAQRIDVSSGGTQGLMNIVLLLEQLEEGRAQRADEADERRLEREETRRRYEDEKMAKRRQEMFSMYQSLKDAKNGEKPRYTDKRINEIMTQWYGDEWRGLMPGEAQITPEAKPEKTRSLTQDIKQEGIFGGLKKAGKQQLGSLTRGAATLFGGEQMGADVGRGLNVLATEAQDPALIPGSALTREDPIRAGLEREDEPVQSTMGGFGEPTESAPFGTIGGVPIADEAAMQAVLRALGQ